MDTFVDSSWYFARFTDPANAAAPTDPGDRRSLAAGRSVYRRHRACDPASALFALLHARDEQVRPSRSRRAVRRPVHAGHGRARDLSRRGRALARAGRGAHRSGRGPASRFLVDGDEPVEIGPIEKMSKSKRNTVDPDEIIATYGADTARWFMLSDSPPERDVIWTEAGVQGAYKQTQRLWRLICEIERVVGPERPAPPADFGDEARRIRRIAHAALAKIEDDIERLRFNVCIATIYELANALGAAVGAIERGAGRRRSALRLRRGGRHPRPLFCADDAASGRGMLGGARPRGLRRPEPVAGRRPQPDRLGPRHRCRAGQRQEARRIDDRARRRREADRKRGAGPRRGRAGDG